MDVFFGKHDTILTNVDYLDLELTLDCGQAFRWEKQDDDSWSGVAGNKYLNIKKDGDSFVLKNTSSDDYLQFWQHYFDFDRDYTSICSRLSEDRLLSEAIDSYYGIRILNQDPWEALCSFIISQNNNISRIKSIIKRLCDACGDPIGGGVYAFPRPEQLSLMSVDDFQKIGAGYRAEYLAQLATQAVSGNIDLQKIKTLPLNDARNELLSILGVGNKVADCALLFGLGFFEAFPMDTWMKKVMTQYGGTMPDCFKGYEGLAQQYLFHWARHNL